MKIPLTVRGVRCRGGTAFRTIITARTLSGRLFEPRSVTIHPGCTLQAFRLALQVCRVREAADRTILPFQCSCRAVFTGAALLLLATGGIGRAEIPRITRARHSGHVIFRAVLTWKWYTAITEVVGNELLYLCRSTQLDFGYRR